MRVISGTARGLKLIAPDNNDIRPTTDRVKESMFNIISSYVYDSVVLDLFAGSGSLGIECISRGAKKVYFCDKSKSSVYILNKNIHKARFEDKSVVFNRDYRATIRNLSDKNIKFDLIFLDPPYYENLFDDVIKMIYENRLLSDDGIIVVEHDKNDEMHDYEGLKITKQKKYGITMLTIYNLEEENE